MLLLALPHVSYHCKHGYDYGGPDPVDILPSSCSGLCLAAISNLAFVVLTYLSPTSPDTPAIKQRKGQTQSELTLNNPCGYVYPYGGLQYVPAPSDEPQQPAAQSGRVGDGLADTVSDAVSGAGFLKACWGKLKARFGVVGEATACSEGLCWPPWRARHAMPLTHAWWWQLQHEVDCAQARWLATKAVACCCCLALLVIERRCAWGLLSVQPCNRVNGAGSLAASLMFSSCLDGHQLLPPMLRSSLPAT
jgi:hypothetical protein